MRKTRSLLVGLIVCGLTLMRCSYAETLVQQNVDTRLIVNLRVSPAEAQKLLPAPWQVNPVASGPAKDANLSLVFYDRLLNLDAEGKPASAAAERGLALSIPAKHPQTGETGPFLIRTYLSNPESLPGPYKAYVHATVQREHTFKGTEVSSGIVNEVWNVRDSRGGAIEFRVQYQQGLPRRSKPQVKVHGGPDQPDFFRIYRVDQGVDVVKSVPAAIDRTQNIQLRVAMSDLRTVFDGTEQIVSILAVPWYMRQAFLP